MSRQYELPVWWLHVRFEQGRGKTGVPKAYIPYYETSGKNWTLESYIKLAVAYFRVSCADPNLGHGIDLMPGRDDEYHLHHVDGGEITEPKFRWQDTTGGKVAELVLTWRNPAVLLGQLEAS